MACYFFKKEPALGVALAVILLLRIRLARSGLDGAAFRRTWADPGAVPTLGAYFQIAIA